MSDSGDSIDEELMYSPGASDDGDDSSDISSPNDDEGDVNVMNVLEVRGAEPYRFEPARVPGEEHEAPAVAGQENQNRLLNTDWCSCDHCVLQPLPENSRCCKEVQEVFAKMTELDINVDAANSCIAEHDWFAACCLHPATLQTAHMQYQTQYGRNAVQGTLDQKYRHVAYRQVVRWCWGYLGRHNRVPLPSCIMDKIRQTYPNADGEYQGFKYPQLDQV